MRYGGDCWRAILGLVLLLPILAQAAVVELGVDANINATAELRNPDGDGDPVLILHGFLQTRDFPTVRRLAGFLADEGHPVLSPTLSLGVPRRSQSLKCEAVHTHTLDQDVQELGQWVAWLHRRTGRPVVLIGHSAGGHVITRYLARYPDAPLKQVILISIAPPAGAPPAAGEPRQEDELAEYSLAYCSRYPTTRSAFHSYADWGPSEMIAAMTGARVPVKVLIGGNDRRLKLPWLVQLQTGGVALVEVPGAGHFFDAEHEFELNDRIEKMLGDGD